MNIIKPTVGRKVWYCPSDLDKTGPVPMSVAFTGPEYTPQPLDATIIAVWSERCVNVLVTDIAGRQFPVLSVTLVHEGDEKPAFGRYVEWPALHQRPVFDPNMLVSSLSGPAVAELDPGPLTILPAGGASADSRLRDMVKAFVAEHRIRSPESIHQTDRVIENAGLFIQQLCNEVGYFEDADDEL